MAFVLGKLSLGVSPLGESKEMLLKVYSEPKLAPNVFDVSSMIINWGFSRTGCCLSNIPSDWPKRVTEVHNNITYLYNCPGENVFNHKSLKKILKVDDMKS